MRVVKLSQRTPLWCAWRVTIHGKLRRRFADYLSARNAARQSGATHGFQYAAPDAQNKAEAARSRFIV
jgi:hypothetical protein